MKEYDGRPTVDVIVEHMNNLGPNARVLLVCEDRKAVIDEEKGIISGEKGLLALNSEQFTAITPERQLTHRLGGVISVTHTEMLGGHMMMGQMYSMVVFDGVDLGQKHISLMIDEGVMLQLRIDPYLFIESQGGVVVNSKTLARK